MDLSTLLGNASGQGLLSPEQQGDVNSQTLQSIAAGMMKASGPSPYKAGMTTLSGLGDALSAGIAGRNAATNAALTQTLVRTNTLDKTLPIFKMAQMYEAEGIPLPPHMQNMLSIAQTLVGGGRAAAMPAPGAAAMPAPGAAAARPVDPNDRYAAAKAALGIQPMALWPGMPGAESKQKQLDEYLHARSPEIAQAELDKKVMEQRIAEHGKVYPALVELGHQGETMKQNADLSVALMKNPNFYSGIGAQVVQAWKSAAASLGGDPNAAVPMQVFGKITSANVNEQINALRGAAAQMGGAAGRVFQLQAELMQKASQSLDNSPASNLVLANMQQRAADNMIAIRDMAIRHTKEHKFLGPEFDEEMSKYLAAHPVLTRAELTNISQRGSVEGAPAPAASAAGGAPAGPGPAGVPGAVGPLGAGAPSAPAPGAYNWNPQTRTLEPAK